MSDQNFFSQQIIVFFHKDIDDDDDMKMNVMISRMTFFNFEQILRRSRDNWIPIKIILEVNMWNK
jgi:hypothetical protein